MNPDRGSPSALPMPKLALMRDTAPAIFFCGSASRRMLIPTGITAPENPWMARPASAQKNVPPREAVNAPTIIIAIAISSIRRLPNMSARRDTMGVATAAVRSVTVTSQDTSSPVTPKTRGYSGSRGTTAVFSRDTAIPPLASVAMMIQSGYLRRLLRLPVPAGSDGALPMECG